MKDLLIYRNAATVTVSDVTDFSDYPSGIYVGSFGNVRLVKPDGTTVDFINVPSASIIPMPARRINATGTTAANMIALYK